MAPYNLWTLLGTPGGFLAYLAIGFAFGFILESAGFGDSRRLAGQFYFRDLAVVRVMMTGILTAMLLVFAFASLGWMDYQDVWVNPTYLVSGVIGGLVMGVGFIVGGYCPGTSLAAAGSGKIDGMFFVGGALTGMFAYGELSDDLAEFMNLTAWGRYTLPQMFQIPTAWAVVGAIGVGIVFYTLMNHLKKAVWSDADPGWFQIGGRTLHPAVLFAPAALLLAPIVAYDVPDADGTYALRADEYDKKLTERVVQIEPIELLGFMYNNDVKLRVLDVRDETSYNLFHLKDAERVPLESLDRVWSKESPGNQLVVVVSNDERDATVAWKRLTAMKVPNTYLLSGGMNGWLKKFGESSIVRELPETPHEEDLCFEFTGALGARHPAAKPSHHEFEHEKEAHPFTPKVKMATKARKGGSCG